MVSLLLEQKAKAVDLWLTDLDPPYQFHRRFDSVPR